jgi:hypothetical protein
MENQLTHVDRQKEAIYDYSDTATNNISNQANVSIEIFFSHGHRKIVINDNGQRKEYTLATPKKPEDTPTNLLRFRFGNESLLVSKDLAELLPSVEKVQ